jgi:hypothetical protein
VGGMNTTETSRRDEMVLEHASLVQACAHLMNGEEPDWNTIILSKNTRKQISDIAQRLRDAKGGAT